MTMCGSVCVKVDAGTHITPTNPLGAPGNFIFLPRTRSFSFFLLWQYTQEYKLSIQGWLPQTLPPPSQRTPEFVQVEHWEEPLCPGSPVPPTRAHTHTRERPAGNSQPALRHCCFLPHTCSHFLQTVSFLPVPRRISSAKYGHLAGQELQMHAF